MYNNNDNAMVEKKNFMLPEMLEGEFTSEELADDYKKSGIPLAFWQTVSLFSLWRKGIWMYAH